MINEHIATPRGRQHAIRTMAALASAMAQDRRVSAMVVSSTASRDLIHRTSILAEASGQAFATIMSHGEPVGDECQARLFLPAQNAVLFPLKDIAQYDKPILLLVNLDRIVGAELRIGLIGRTLAQHAGQPVVIAAVCGAKDVPKVRKSLAASIEMETKNVPIARLDVFSPAPVSDLPYRKMSA